MPHDPLSFVRSHTHPGRASLVPEVQLYLADEVTPLWLATEDEAGQEGLPPPYWGYAWPGGQAVARYLLDRPEIVRGRRVLDFASGGGVTAVAAALCGGTVRAAEIDRFAAAAIGLNAALNEVTVEVVCDDVVGRSMPDIDVIVAGDVCYERPMAERVLDWLHTLAREGRTVLLGDPGRAYLPRHGLEKRATYTVPTSLDLEDKTERLTAVWQVAAG